MMVHPFSFSTLPMNVDKLSDLSWFLYLGLVQSEGVPPGSRFQENPNLYESLLEPSDVSGGVSGMYPTNTTTTTT